MNTQVTIDVNGDPVKILECAYDTLLSMGEQADKYNVSAYIDRKFLFARACIIRRYYLLSDFVSLITVRKVDGLKCELTLTTDCIKYLDNSGKGTTIFFMSEFLKMFSQNFEQTM